MISLGLKSVKPSYTQIQQNPTAFLHNVTHTGKMEGLILPSASGGFSIVRSILMMENSKVTQFSAIYIGE